MNDNNNSSEYVVDPVTNVEPAIAERVLEVEPAIAEQAIESTSVSVHAPQVVEPAITQDEEQKQIHILRQKYDDDNMMMKKKGMKSDDDDGFVSVEKLRDNGMGIDFEGYIGICDGASSKNILQRILPILYDERDYISYGEIKKYIVIQNTYMFVYNEPYDMKPQYAISLLNNEQQQQQQRLGNDNDNNRSYRIIQEDYDKPDPSSATISPLPNTNKPKKEMITILFKYNNIKNSTTQGRKNNRKQNNPNHQHHHHPNVRQFTIDTTDDPTVAKRFLQAVRKNAIPSKTTIATTTTTTMAETTTTMKK